MAAGERKAGPEVIEGRIGSLPLRLGRRRKQGQRQQQGANCHNALQQHHVRLHFQLAWDFSQAQRCDLLVPSLGGRWFMQL